MAANCPGIREQDSVRPIASCQSCECWKRTTGQPITPHIVVEFKDAMPVLICTRREPVKG